MHTALEQYKFTSERVNYVRAIILLYLTNYQATSTHTHTPNMETTGCNFIQGEKRSSPNEKERKRLEKRAKNEENYSLYLLLVEHYENE